MKLKIIYSILSLALIALALSAWWYWSPKPMFRQVTFNQLPGWNTAEFKKSLLTFQTSCRAFIKQDPDRIVGTDKIDLQVKDWQPACRDTVRPADSLKRAGGYQGSERGIVHLPRR